MEKPRHKLNNKLKHGLVTSIRLNHQTILALTDMGLLDRYTLRFKKKKDNLNVNTRTILKGVRFNNFINYLIIEAYKQYSQDVPREELLITLKLRTTELEMKECYMEHQENLRLFEEKIQILRENMERYAKALREIRTKKQGNQPPDGAQGEVNINLP